MPTPTGEVLEHDFESQLASLESGAATTTVSQVTQCLGAENHLESNQTRANVPFAEHHLFNNRKKLCNKTPSLTALQLPG